MIRFRIKPRKIYVMGVLNVTPDSFSDGGDFLDTASAVARAVRMKAEGADIIDIGGESTRPGSGAVSLAEELRRVIPVIRQAAKKTKIPISVDTRRSDVASQAVRAGACIINDVSGLNHDPMMADVAARTGSSVIIMHMKGTPADMQKAPKYRDLIKEIRKYLLRSIGAARRAGIKKDRIIVDPGIGFGKTVSHNLEILDRMDEIASLGYPVCVGTSRKSFIGKVLKIEDPACRLAGTIATSILAAVNGASILRVHDVRQAVEAVKMLDAVKRHGTL